MRNTQGGVLYIFNHKLYNSKYPENKPPNALYPIPLSTPKGDV